MFQEKRLQILACLNMALTVLVFLLLRGEIAGMKATVGYQPPPASDFITRVDKLEAQVAKDSNWPKTSDEAKKLRDDYEAVASEAPLTIPVDLNKRLHALRWNIEALSYSVADDLKNPAAAGFDELEFVSRDVLLGAPESANDAIKKNLEVALERARPVKCDAAVKKAREAIDAVQKLPSATAAKKQADAFHDVEVAFNQLEPFKDREDVTKVRDEIGRLVAKRELDAQLKQLNETLDIAQRAQDQKIKQAGILRAVGEAIEIHYRIAAASSVDENKQALKQVETVLKRCESLAGNSADEKLRKYQQWALEQIKEYDNWHYDQVSGAIKDEFASFASPDKDSRWELLERFPAVRQVLSDKTGVKVAGATLNVDAQKAIYEQVYSKFPGDYYYQKDLTYCTMREAAKRYLLTIDSRLLEPPVARFYEKAFEYCWQKLGDRPDEQLELAKAAAVVHKKTLEDL